MPSWAATTLRWTLAIAAMALVVFIAAPMAMDQLLGAVTFGDGDDDEAPGRTQPAGPPPVETGTAAATVAVGLRNAVIRDVGEPLVFLAPGAAEEMLIGFDPLPADQACLTNVLLQVSLVESIETEVYVRPGRVPDLPARADGEALGPDAFVDIAGPAVAFTSGAPGRLQWDVTDAYALAAREAGAEGTVVLRVSATTSDDPDDVTVLHTGAEVEAERATLQWTAVSGCEDLGTDFDADPMGQET